MCTEQCIQLCILANFLMNVWRIFVLLSLQLHYIQSYLCYLNSSPLLPTPFGSAFFSFSLLARTYSMCTSPPLAAVISNYPCRGEQERESHRRRRRRTLLLFSLSFGSLVSRSEGGRGGGDGCNKSTHLLGRLHSGVEGATYTRIKRGTRPPT